MIYSSNRWDAVDGPLASAWEAVPLYLRFRKYQAGEHCYLARAEHTFLLNFVTHDTPLGFRGPHYCPNSSGLWIASAEGDDKPKVFDVDGFRDFFARLRVNRLLWWRAFEDEEEARVRPVEKQADK
ncbi:hypothetical protein A1Q1_01799 [Trichosporon asahii var. asahii CBS 2479]|uniref:Uncharacterized protein n=1 Tax=Trichosporon asahii var. asahii (strain ATCC 90039 / CBS 2479 / JCM 2466 / KCTC 7840 / NBRC 103889/ NCYC 2677 / UAMH 7654) TaxID=1186058 RepID=J4UDF5_TRIAS|nr:hypothetical protein A1Q1_01799 [Trichosporon asahii var. asahii CBS 2479]EJT49150.1 hypothetical protein A1Q1_01799 [Trichosporon asahii var. asahii CBS 2479]